MERAAYNILLSVDDPVLQSLLQTKLTEAGFAPREIAYDSIFGMSPVFGPEDEAIFFVYAGPDRQRMHALADHLYREWSEQGSVLYIVFHPGKVREEDLFKLWALDALWKYNAPQAFVVLNRPLTDNFEESAEEIVRVLLRFLGER